MTLSLGPIDEALLAGDLGPAARLAMSILVRMAHVYDARAMLDITGAHVDSTIYVGDAGLEFAERLADLGARVSVPTTLNVSGLDEHHWREWTVPADWAEKAHRQMVAYQSMGTIPTWTCAPYQTEHAPKLGQQIAWGESNAIVYANSVLGARTERYPDFLDICAAITGRVPAVGLHLDANRVGQVVLDLSALPRELAERDDFYSVLGYLVGRLAEDRIPVLSGLSAIPSHDQLKALGAAAASSGSVGLFHLVGVTPEAPTLAHALGGRAPEKTMRISMSELRSAREALTTATGEALDLVVLGSPHFSIDELRRLAPLLEGRTCHTDVTFLVTTSRIVRELSERAGLLRSLESFGGRVTVDTCILATPMLPKSVKRLMTSSGKYAFYSPGLLDVEVVFGSLEDCVCSAVEGRVVRLPSPWDG
ncbi:MAG TPA: aconitase X catalytic domain-containing protein [Vicinamibacteria bacterium]|nr:aconitase X catalytic domain-containing protein [Vicinamibacteria bacterium]